MNTRTYTEDCISDSQSTLNGTKLLTVHSIFWC